MIASPTIFDRSLRRRRLDRAAASHARAGFLHQRAARDLAERLAMLSRTFPVGVELGARQGGLARALGEAAPGKVGLLIETGLSARMLGSGPRVLLVADEERLPLAAASVDLVISALALHWTNDLVGALIQARQALKEGGLFLGALLGGATLTELRQVLLEAEIEILGGAGPRVSPFADAADAAGLLSRAGLVEPVVDVDRVSVRYDHPLRLLADLRAMGETSVLAQRPGPLRRAVVARASEIYLQRFSGADGRISASFEILTLTGWAPGPTPSSGGRRDRGADVVEHRIGALGEEIDRGHDRQEDHGDDQAVLHRRRPAAAGNEPLQSQSRSHAASGASAGGIG